MGVSKVGVTTFELSSGSPHLIHVDSDLTLMTVRIEGLSSASYIRLVRPDGNQNRIYSHISTKKNQVTISFDEKIMNPNNTATSRYRSDFFWNSLR